MQFALFLGTVVVSRTAVAKNYNLGLQTTEAVFCGPGGNSPRPRCGHGHACLGSREEAFLASLPSLWRLPAILGIPQLCLYRSSPRLHFHMAFTGLSITKLPSSYKLDLGQTLIQYDLTII